MTPQIVRIEDAGPDRRARRLVFDDSTEPRITSAHVLKSLGIAVGMDVPVDALEAALAEAEYPLAKERALLLLGYRDRSRSELMGKLRDSGYSAAIAQRVADRFVEIQLVDDERFAAAWVRSRSAAGFGARRIARELAEKGIAPESASAALATVEDADEQLALAHRALRGRRAADRKERDKLVRRLVSKGYTLQIALQATELGQAEDDSEL
jgi:regulatory protein